MTELQSLNAPSQTAPESEISDTANSDSLNTDTLNTDTQNSISAISEKLDYQHLGKVGRAILNGVIGDYLVQENNPLAITMGFYYRYKLVKLRELATNPPTPLTNKVVVFLHGLTNLETIWHFKSGHQQSYGSKLQQDLGFTPFYLRYNTGLAIEQNGQNFSKLLDELIQNYPINIDELVLVGFSMGGLVMRHAQKTADAGSSWLNSLSQCYYLGTPHHGSPLEKFGNLASSLVRAIPKDYVSQWADWIDVRSKGIQDLKDGFSTDQSATSYSQLIPCKSFHPNATHHFISGSISPRNNSFVNQMFGDSLVRKNSALPAVLPNGSLTAHFDGIPHLPLAHSQPVYDQIRKWAAANQPKIKAICYKPEANEALITESDQTDSSKEMLTGTLDLLSAGFDKTVSAIENMHQSIAREPHQVLQKLPVIKPVAKVVEVTQATIAGSVYRSVKLGGQLIQETSEILKEDYPQGKAS
ncbi:hypothetical protein [Litoribacillus peritrichatus]|uniref:DUF676 domain-containing protein n=1 Tax=Litoribacillus peritrichatus TaxID=718191 RepID=A0ABP7MS05_9GAMM